MELENNRFPLWVSFEGWITQFPYLEYLITKFQQIRKKFYIQRFNTLKKLNPSSLRNYEGKVFSQYGEDGIVTEILRRTKITGGFCLEFGIENGTECNARNLLETSDWSAVLIDGSAKNVKSAQVLYADNPKVKVVESFLTVENILELFAELSIPTSPDLLSVDIDGNDYWIWERILTRYTPKVIVIEYNAKFSPPTEWIMPYNPSHQWDFSARFGASLASLVKLGAKYRYSLVCCNFAGNNAFFVRSDLLKDRFPDQDMGTSYHYSAPLYCQGFGHPVRPPSS